MTTITHGRQRLVERDVQERLNMAFERGGCAPGASAREAGKPLGGDPVAVRLKRAHGGRVCEYRHDARTGLLPHEYDQLAKGAQENRPQHSDACRAYPCSSISSWPAAEHK